MGNLFLNLTETLILRTLLLKKECLETYRRTPGCFWSKKPGFCGGDVKKDGFFTTEGLLHRGEKTSDFLRAALLINLNCSPPHDKIL